MPRPTEGVGFEPTRACALPVFKTGAINHSTTPPKGAPPLPRTADNTSARAIGAANLPWKLCPGVRVGEECSALGRFASHAQLRCDSLGETVGQIRFGEKPVFLFLLKFRPDQLSAVAA